MLLRRATLHGAWSTLHSAAALLCHADGPSTSGRPWSSSASTPSGDDSPQATHISQLQCRGVVRMIGKESLEFLQGMVTNDITPLEVPGGPPVYAALLTPKGKFLHDAFIYSTSGDEVLLDVDAASTARFIKWLTLYRLRRRIDISDASQQLSVWVVYGDGSAPVLREAPHHQATAFEEALGAASGAATAGAAARAAEGAAASTSEAKHGAATGWHTDPRLPELGLRALLPAAARAGAELACEAARQLPVEGAQHAAADSYKRLRYSLGVPEGDTEIASGKAAPQEYNLDALHGISYTKGCYIGQERTSFTHHRGIIRKRLMPIRLLQGGTADTSSFIGAEVLQEGSSSSRSIGTVVAGQGDVGLAHLRLAPALAAASGSATLRIGTSGPVVMPVRPAWWPEEWGREEGLEQGG